MIVRIHNAGKSFQGLATYLTHDAKAQSDERVDWTHTLNLAHDHVPSAVDEMLWTARSAELLKQEAGLSAGGRQTENAIKHVSLNWAPEETPTREHMIETVEDFLRHMKWQDHQTLIVSHDDKPHAHVHLMINTVNPETGLHLDDNFDKRRAQKWALGYEQENGRIHCAQRLESIGEREDAPTRPAWMAFHEKQKEFERDENALANQAPNLSDEQESPRLSNFDEWKKLKEFQRQERTDFFAEGKSEFSELRRIINREVREEFRERWADFYAYARVETDQIFLAEAKTKLVAEQKEELESRRDLGCEMLREARDEQYQVLLEYQQDTRHSLRTRQEAGLDNTLFLQLMDEGTLRDRWPDLATTVSASTINQEMKQEAKAITGERQVEEVERGEPAVFPDRVEGIDRGVTSGVARGADIASDLGLGLIFFFDKIFSGPVAANSNPRPQHAEPPSRDPFEGVAEDAKKRQQAEKEEADGEWRKRQRSYGE